MQKIALPIIFLTAVGAALSYVSQEEHGTGTLLLLAAVLLVGQTCATLPFIFEAKKPRTGTNSQTETALSQKIIANQQVIHEDLRALGETLTKRLGAISDHQNELGKKLLATAIKKTPDVADELEDFFGKINRSLEEHFEALPDPAEEKKPIESLRESLNARLDEIDDRLDELLLATEANAMDDGGEDSFVAAPAAEIAPVLAETNASTETTEEEEGFLDEEKLSAVLEDFPEDDDATESVSEMTEDDAVKQEEFDLGVFPQKHGATLVLEAMIGIGNKPFLRGNSDGLSENAGIPMDFVEIGKWSFDFKPFSEEITVRVLRNDDENDPLGEAITLSPGQTLELAYVPEKA